MGAAAGASERITMVAVKQPLLKILLGYNMSSTRQEETHFLSYNPPFSSSYLDETEILTHSFYAARVRDTDTQEYQQQDPQSTQVRPGPAPNLPSK